MQRQDTTTTRERVDRFARLGGVDLSRLRDAEDPLRATVEVGTANFKRAVFTFRCPICGHTEKNDQDMPPACTGPSWLDEHPLEPMIRSLIVSPRTPIKGTPRT